MTQPVQADPTLLGYLGRALSLELSAVQLYSTQARLVATWGLDEASAQLGAEAREEMNHVERILSRMLALGVAPGASQLRPARLGPDLAALLRIDLAFEDELIGFYAAATAYCARAGRHEDRLFFETLLGEEREHEQALRDWIETLTGRAQAPPRVRAGAASPAGTH